MSRSFFETVQTGANISPRGWVKALIALVLIVKVVGAAVLLWLIVHVAGEIEANGLKSLFETIWNGPGSAE